MTVGGEDARLLSQDSNRSDRADLWRRLASSIVLAPIAIGAAYLGGIWFVLFWTFAGVGVAREWLNLVDPTDRWTGLVVASAALGTSAALFAMSGLSLAVLPVLLGAAGVAAIRAGRRRWAAAGIIYSGLIVLAPLSLRLTQELGFIAILFVFAVVWATDIFAYFAGRAFGGARLWSAVSPNKTWSGALAGTFGSVLAGAAVALAAELRVGAALIFLCLLLSIVSQAGDLFESAMKRRFGAKDSSHLIPGHGGLMDRLDGFAAAASVAAAIGIMRGGVGAPAQGLLVW